MKLSSEAARLSAEYQRKWRAAHKDKSAEYSRRYWERRAAKEKAAELEKLNGDSKKT